MSLLDKNLESINWPKIDDLLFDTSNNFYGMSAHLDFIGKKDKFYLYAVGYQEAAEMIYKNINNNSSYQDILVYPIVFLYRQSFELFMKDIIITGHQILHIAQEYPKHHFLRKLWMDTKSVISEISTDHDKNELIAVEAQIIEFDLIDQKSFAFRYPENKKGEESLPGLERIDLSNFYEVSTGICNYLNGTSSMLADYLDNLER